MVAVIEWGALECQRRREPSDSDWKTAAAFAVGARGKTDVIVVAPRWADSLGRKALGEVSAAGNELRVAARADLEGASRVLELSIRGKDDPDLARWRLVSTQRFGQVSLRVFENPSRSPVLRDLVDEVDETAKVTRIQKTGTSEACRWESGATARMPGLGSGPIASPNRWLCPPFDPSWSFVGPTVLTDLSYNPRRCIAMHPAGSAVTSIELPPRPIGGKIVGHVGIHVFSERDLKYDPVMLRVSVDGKPVTHVRHRDGDGWLRFEVATSEFRNTSKAIKLELWVEGQDAYRMACVSAQVRD